jgi:acetyl esterase
MLEAAAAADIPALSDGTPDQARVNYARAPKPAGDPLERVEDAHIPGPAGPIPVRIYAATTAADLPIIAFFHGGGWVLSSIEGHDSLARRLAARTGAMVVSVEYRLAPEHPFPAPHDDCLAATHSGWPSQATPPVATWRPGWRCEPATKGWRCNTSC